MLILLGNITGFAAFDPDEKDHILGAVKCDVIMRDSVGEVVAKVHLTALYFAHRYTDSYKCVLTFKVEGMELHNMRA